MHSTNPQTLSQILGPSELSSDFSDVNYNFVAQMDKDLAGSAGPRSIRRKIAYHNSVHLNRDFILDCMHKHDDAAFAKREPTAKKIFCAPKYPLGIHEKWAGDGHDKLYKIGFPIWAMVDDTTGKWLGAYVVPSNRMGDVVAYLFLDLVEKYGGVPLTVTTDCGSETTKIFGIANAIREHFHPEISVEELPPHRYLRSVHNISIERSWFRLRLNFGDTAVLCFNKGVEDGLYNSNDLDQYELCQWLWSKLLKKELHTFVEVFNGSRCRFDKKKPGPSGMSRNHAFSLPEEWNGRNLLQRISPEDLPTIRAMKEKLGGDMLVAFSTPEFDLIAQAAYSALNIRDLSFENVWFVFTDMFQILHPDAE